MPEIAQDLGNFSALNNPEHSGISQGIGLDAFKLEKFSDPFIIGKEQLGINLRINGSSFNYFKSIPSKKFSLKGKAEKSSRSN
jgi:hypothetical protein